MKRLLVSLFLIFMLCISIGATNKRAIFVDPDTGETYEVEQIELDGDNNARLTLDIIFSADWIYKIGKAFLIYVNQLEDELANNVTIEQLKEAVDKYGTIDAIDSPADEDILTAELSSGSKTWTTDADWNAGTLTDVAVASDSVTLAEGTPDTIESCTGGDGYTDRLLGDWDGNEYDAAQGFQLSLAKEITSIEFNIRAWDGSPTGAISVRIETDSGGKPSGTLAHANASGSVVSPTTEWNVCTFASSFELQGSTQYHIVLDAPDQANNVRWQLRCASSNANNPYADGMYHYRVNVGSWTAYGSEPTYYDLYFKVNAIVFESSGSIESNTYDPTKEKNWGTFSWNWNSVQTLTCKVETKAADSGWDLDNASAATSGNDISALASVTDGDQYFRFKFFFSTADTSETPQLDDCTLTYTSTEDDYEWHTLAELIAASITLDDIPDGSTYTRVLASVAAGDLIYRTDTGWGILLKGADDEVLTMNGNYPNWEASAGGASEFDDQGTYLEPKDAGESIRTKADFQIVSAANRLYMVNDWAAIQVAQGLYVLDSNGEEIATIHGDGVVDLPKQSRCCVYLNARQTITSGTDTKIQFNAEVFDENSEYDNTTNYRFTAKVAGYYYVGVNAWLVDLPDGEYIQTMIAKNGTNICTTRIFCSKTVQWPSAYVGKVTFLDVGDYLEGIVRHDTGSNKDCYGAGESYTFMSIHKLS